MRIRLLLTSLFFVFLPASLLAQNETAKPDLIDSLIAVCIILFLMSVIVEKITQLIRKYSPFIKPHYPSPLRKTVGTFWRNINKKQTGYNSLLDKRIEREVGTLSFVTGLIIVLAFRVDLFLMLKNGDPRQTLFWSKTNIYSTWDEILLFMVSSTLTAFFLTFGSKFFHDLLDMLFQVKNLKRKAVDENTYNVETIAQFDEYIEKSYSAIIEMAIQQNQSCFSDTTVIVSPPMHGRMMKDGKLVDCIDVHVSGSNRGNIPYMVQTKMEKGQTIQVPVNVIFNVDVPTALAKQGDSISNKSTADFRGTICCLVRQNTNNRKALLTCSHVLTGGSARNFFGTIDPEMPGILSGQQQGKFFWAVCDDRFDIALIDPDAENFTYLFTPEKERNLTTNDIASTKVKVVRQQGRGIANGEVVNHRVPRPVPIKYKEGQVMMVNLIILASVVRENETATYTSLTDEGDSGACVYDEKNSPIGMIVAGSARFSYAIPIIDILGKMNASIIT